LKKQLNFYELAMLIKVANTFTPTSKRKFLNLIIKRADEGFDETSRLHKLNIKFRLPLLSDSDGVIKHNPINNDNSIGKVKYFKSLGTPVNTGGPNHPRSTLLHCYTFC